MNAPIDPVPFDDAALPPLEIRTADVFPVIDAALAAVPPHLRVDRVSLTTLPGAISIELWLEPRP